MFCLGVIQTTEENIGFAFFFWNAVDFLTRINERCYEIVHNREGIRDEVSKSGVRQARQFLPQFTFSVM